MRLTQGQNFLAAALDDPDGTTEAAKYSSRWIEDGSFIRLDNVTIGYMIDTAQVLSQLTSARIYFSANNLLTITGYEGYDPEVNTNAGLATIGIDYTNYPRSLHLYIGCSPWVLSITVMQSLVDCSPVQLFITHSHRIPMKDFIYPADHDCLRESWCSRSFFPQPLFCKGARTSARTRSASLRRTSSTRRMSRSFLRLHPCIPCSGPCFGITHNLSQVSSDETLVPTRGSDWFDGGRWLSIHRHTWDPGLSDLNGAWIESYTGIARANGLLQILEEAGNTDAALNAEIRSLRAFYYFLLLDLFGNVPIVGDDEFVIDAENPPPTESRSAVYNFVVSELTAAVPDLPAQWSGSNRGRVTKGAAKLCWRRCISMRAYSRRTVPRSTHPVRIHAVRAIARVQLLRQMP